MRHGVLQRNEQGAGPLVKGLAGALQGLVELRGGAGHCLAHFALQCRGLGACALPFGSERAGRALHGSAPAFQPQLVGGGLGGVGLVHGFLERTQQRTGALLEAMRHGLQRPIELRDQMALGVFVAVQRVGPGGGDLAGCALPLGGQGLHLRIGGLAQALVRALGLLCQGGHGLFDHGADGLAGLAGAGGQVLLQRRAHGAGQRGVRTGRIAVKALLLGDQLLVELPMAALQALHQALQALGNQWHGLGLGLQGGKHRFAPVGRREGPQHGGDAGVEQAQHLKALAAGDGGHQAQHGRGGDAGHRGAERQAQALDGRGQCRADGLQVGRCLQREHGAIEGDHHAQKGAQHAQHDQEAHQVGGEGRTGQGHALAFDALAHGRAQGRVQALQPGTQVRLRRCRVVGQRRSQRGARRAELRQLIGAQQVHPGDHRRHRQRQRAGPHEPPGHPSHHRQAGCKHAGHHTLVHS
ncbi:hypothetical protein ASE28_06035 [Acidovorax sp. Root219]|nr:hypothetical protein ASE28_06035 [Acidovorax sp. Root219]